MLARRNEHRPSLLRRASGDAGFTLIEVLIASTLSIVVLTAVLSLLITSQEVQSRNDEWAQVIQEARTGLAAMTHDIRQAYSILGTSKNSIEFYATIQGTSYEIEYDCTVPQEEDAGGSVPLYECVRREAQFTEEGGKSTPPSSLPAKGEPIIRDVLNGSTEEKEPIFKEFSPNSIAPDYVKIRLAVPSGGTLNIAATHKVILSDGAYIRNMALGV